MIPGSREPIEDDEAGLLRSHAFFVHRRECITKVVKIMTDRLRLTDITVAIVDDHEIILEGFRSFIEKSGVCEVAAFTTAQQLLSVVVSRRYDVYIIDVELTDMNASELIDRIRAVQPDARIVINTMHEEMWVVSKMTDKQVDGVVYKSGQLSQLIEAIEAVIEGRQFFCDRFKRSQKRLQLQNDVPTQRELQVLEAIARGQSTKEIAYRLYISENTVENHRKSLFRKLQAHNMADLIIRAIASGYIKPEELASNSLGKQRKM